MKPSKVQKGDAAVLLLASQLTEAGLVVLQPLCEAVPFDLALFHKRRFFRIQVKRAQRLSEGRYILPLRKVTVNAHRTKVYRYSEEHTDFIAGVVVEKGCSYVFPIGEIRHVSTEITLDPDQLTPKNHSPSRKVESEEYRGRIVLGEEEVLLGGATRCGDGTRFEIE